MRMGVGVGIELAFAVCCTLGLLVGRTINCLELDDFLL